MTSLYATDLIDAPAPRLIGRADEQRALDALLATHTLVIVRGEPGVGKSALASEASDAATPLVVELSSCTSGVGLGELIEGRVRDALVAQGRATTTEDTPLTDLLTAEDRVVLDNADGVAAVLAPWLVQLCAASPCRWIVTTRAALEDTSELDAATLTLGGMRPDEAVALFLHHAPYLSVSQGADARVWIERICARLDHNPLAILLAAARTRALSLGQLDARLDIRLALLRTSAPDARHTSLNAALECSWEGLDDEAQAAMKVCAVFRGGFSVEAFLAVQGRADTERLAALTALEHSSLLQQGDEGLYRISESVRLFAEAKQDAGARAALVRRHDAHYSALSARLAAQARAGRPEDICALVADELDNIIAAYRRADREDPDSGAPFIALFQELLRVRHQTTGMLTLVGLCVDEEEERQATPETQARSLGERAEQLLHRGETAAALRDLRTALSLIKNLNQPRLALRLEQSLAAAHLRRGQLDAAKHHYERAIHLAVEEQDTTTHIKTLTRLGRLFMTMQDLERATPRLEHALELLTHHPIPSRRVNIEAKLCAYLAEAYVRLGRLHEAAEIAQRGLIALRPTRGSTTEGSLRMTLASAARAGGHQEEAERQYTRAMGMAPALAAACLTALGELAQERGDEEAAAQRWREAIREDASPRAALNLAIVLASRGEVETALGFAEDAASWAERQNHALAALANALLDTLDPTSAAPSHKTDDEDAALDAGVALLALKTSDAPARERIARIDAIELSLRAKRPCADPREPECVLVQTRAILRWVRADIARLNDPNLSMPDVAQAGTLRVAPDHSWFCSAEGSCKLKRKRVLRRIFTALLERHRETPGGALTANELIAIGWPDQPNVIPESASNRLYVALNRLRGEGLDSILLTTREGYCLDPMLRVIEG